MPHFEIHASGTDRAKAVHAGLFGREFLPKEEGEEIGEQLIASDGVGPDHALSGGQTGGIAIAPADHPGIGRRAHDEDGRSEGVGIITPAEGEH